MISVAHRGASPVRRRRALAAGVLVVVMLVAGCSSSPLPNTVLAGTTATVGWSSSMTSTNTASVVGSQVAGNTDVGALTRSQFAELVDGSVVVDEEFGTVGITQMADFTVAYDLAETRWSDGIPLDAADLLLAWAAGSNGLAPEDFDPGTERDDLGDLALADGDVWFDSVATGMRQSRTIPTYDEFERRIEVTFERPVEDWQTALDVAVPAHVVGQRAFGLDDPMEAKQAVIEAITGRDDVALAQLAAVWNTAFRLGTSSTVADDLLLSSGPYRVESIDQSTPDAQVVQLVANRDYVGSATGEFEHIVMRQTPRSEQLGLVGDTLDLVQVLPTEDNRITVRDLERNDFGVTTTNDGTYWALVLRTDAGDFRFQATREAFLGAVPRSALTQAGYGAWRSYQQVTDVLLFPAGTQNYEVALEDSGFRDKYDLSVDDAIAARDDAGVASGTGICVLYDTGSAYAGAVFAALRQGVAEAGWKIQECGADSVSPAASGEWEAVITQLPVPRSGDEIARYWGTDGGRSYSALDNEDRDELIDTLRRTTDVYEARDVRVQIEASIVDDAIALPLAMSMTVTIADRDITGGASRPGSPASLTGDAIEWGVAAGG